LTEKVVLLRKYWKVAGSLGEGSMTETKNLFGKKSMGFTSLTWEK